MATEMPTTAGVFTRARLVRQVKTQDVMYYGVQQIALSYIVFIVLARGFYPGGSMLLAALIANVAGVAMDRYAMFATLYPRSGGEYVYLSRTLAGRGFRRQLLVRVLGDVLHGDQRRVLQPLLAVADARRVGGPD